MKKAHEINVLHSCGHWERERVEGTRRGAEAYGEMQARVPCFACQRRERGNHCVLCGQRFVTPAEFPDDNVCDVCAEKPLFQRLVALKDREEAAKKDA